LYYMGLTLIFAFGGGVVCLPLALAFSCSVCLRCTIGCSPAAVAFLLLLVY